MTNYNKEYVELIRRKSQDLRDIGVFYKTMAKDCNVGYSTVRNFVCGYRDGMSEKNWEKFCRYIEETWDLLRNRRGGPQNDNEAEDLDSTDGKNSTRNS